MDGCTFFSFSPNIGYAELQITFKNCLWFSFLQASDVEQTECALKWLSTHASELIILSSLAVFEVKVLPASLTLQVFNFPTSFSYVEHQTKRQWVPFLKFLV